MKVAMIQTKQNDLYSFHKPDFTISHDHALALQEEMVEQCFTLAKKAIGQGCDLLVTTEAINFCGQKSALGDSCEDLIPLYPGNVLFSELSCLAKDARSWLVAGVYNKRYDKSGNLFCYNSAFVYDRDGNLKAIYDKIHLTESEKECLITGKNPVVIDTDMGRMGLAICYDMQFEDVCMECKKEGADFMAVPTWGWEHGYGMKRIQETGLEMVLAMAVPFWMPIEGLRSPSELIDGTGRVLAAAGCTQPELLIGELPIRGKGEVYDGENN